MTALTERYLLNYLEKKSLRMAAEMEVNEVNRLISNLKRNHLEPLIQAQQQRRGNALAIYTQLCNMEEEAYTAYMDHLRSET